MKRKVISIILSIVIIISSLAASVSAFASSQELYLNIKTSAVMSGKDDLEWFYFTPEQSGLYSFLSFNVPRSDGYLFIKDIDKTTGEKKYIQLAYSNHDPNYKQNDHNELQFCITYHLEAGTTYYFAAGWWLSSQTRTTFTVMLRCDSYDEEAIESIEILDMPDLEAYTGGEWRTDARGKSYYHYSLARIIKNSTIKVDFTNGTSVTAVGQSAINGYQLNFLDNQYTTHWYPVDDEDYSGNTIVVEILNKSARHSINIIIGSRYSVKGKVVDLNNQPVENALVTIDLTTCVTGSDGVFSIYCPSGVYPIEIKTSSSVDYKGTISINTSENDLRSNPFTICNCNYVKDGYVNAKDYKYINKKLTGSEQTKALSEFPKAINFTSNSYNKK